jgi:hypothetical protein
VRRGDGTLVALSLNPRRRTAVLQPAAAAARARKVA